jgi:hypothetical protein
MNRSKRSIPIKLRKKMSKAIRSAQIGMPVPETLRYSDELTAKEMLKKYPKKAAQKKEQLLEAMQRSMSAKKAKEKSASSKRTTPGSVSSESAHAHTHREGKRWIKTLTKQTLAQRAIEAHHGRKK